MKDKDEGIKGTFDWGKADVPETVERGRELIESSPEALSVYKSMVWSVGLRLEQADRMKAKRKKRQEVRESLYQYEQALWNCYGDRIERLCDYNAYAHCFISSRIKQAIESLGMEFIG